MRTYADAGLGGEMKFNCGLTPEELREEKRKKWCVWHKWFAWHPVRVGRSDCRWLETVERKAQYVSVGIILEARPYECEYRAVEKPS
ncbi:hypothetical protein EDF68_10329 [Ochrobactrum sp. BH3]|nr:hypothetical protein EDF68_10329 [Ochrobactrum sp. BH3]